MTVVTTTAPPNEHQDNPLTTAKLPGRRRLAVWIIAVLFTLLALHWSERHGRLAQDPTYDDVGYMLDGAARQQVLDTGGLAGLAGDLVRHPPHTAFSTLLALASFETLGICDWAPYAFNGFVLAAYLFFCARLLGRLPAGAFYCLLGFCLTIPFALRAVHDFRPDLACALATAAFAWFGLATGLSDEKDEEPNSARAGVLLGAALWIKPPVFAHTVAIAVVTGALIVACGFLPAFRRRGLGRSVFLAIRFGVIGILVASPYYLVNGRQTFAYFTQNTRGTDAHIWNFHGSTWTFLRVFVLDGAESLFVGRYLWVLLACCAAALVWAIRTRRSLLAAQVGGLLLISAASLTIFVLGGHNSEFFGLFYELLVLAAALTALGALLAQNHRSLFFLAPLLLLLGLTPPVSTAVMPFWTPTPEADPARGWNRLLVSKLVADAGFQPGEDTRSHAPIPVFISFAGFVNSQSLQWICLKQGLPFVFSDLLASGDASAQLRAAAEADYVVVSTPAAKSVFAELPSTAIAGTVLDALQKDPGFREVKTVTGSAPAYRLFRHRDDVDQFKDHNAVEIGWPVTGFLPVEGPYPQLHLPKVRWGLLPRSVLTVTVPRAGTGSLKFYASAEPGAKLQIKVNGEPVGEHIQQTPKAEPTELTLPLRAGENVLSLDYTVPVVNPAAGGRAFLFRDIELATPP